MRFFPEYSFCVWQFALSIFDTWYFFDGNCAAELVAVVLQCVSFSLISDDTMDDVVCGELRGSRTQLNIQVLYLNWTMRCSRARWCCVMWARTFSIYLCHEKRLHKRYFGLAFFTLRVDNLSILSQIQIRRCHRAIMTQKSEKCARNEFEMCCWCERENSIIRTFFWQLESATVALFSRVWAFSFPL